jgi:hypothetical protein
MTKEYEARVTSTQPFYSNLNSYGSSSQHVFIVDPIPVESYPTLFSDMTPHQLPKWMNPNNHEKKTNSCDSYNVFSKQQEKCDRFE